MPVLRSVIQNLMKQYSGDKKKAESVYFAMENAGKLDKAKHTAALRSKQGKQEYMKI